MHLICDFLNELDCLNVKTKITHFVPGNVQVASSVQNELGRGEVVSSGVEACKCVQQCFGQGFPFFNVNHL